MRASIRSRCWLALVFFTFFTSVLEAKSLCLRFIQGWSDFKRIPAHLQPLFDQTTPAEKVEIHDRFKAIAESPGSPEEIWAMLLLAADEKISDDADISLIEMSTRKGMPAIKDFLETAGHIPEERTPQLDVGNRSLIRAVLGNLGVTLAAAGSNVIYDGAAPYVFFPGLVFWNAYVYSRYDTESQENLENSSLQGFDEIVQGKRKLQPDSHIILHRRPFGQPNRVYILLSSDSQGELTLDVVRWAHRERTAP